MNKEKKPLKIKVIKKNRIGVESKPKVKQPEPEQQITREISSKVSEWVEDLRQRRFNESQAAIDSVFKPQPQNI